MVNSNSGGRPLHGLRILDLTRLLPGPLCTQHMADLGADVIKIEDLRRGDYAPAFVRRAVNRNKRGLLLDLKDQEGVEIFLKLVRTADAVVEGFRPGVVDRLGVGFEAARAVNPKIVYCSITGFGQDGSLRDMGGHDINYCALSGFLDLVANTSSPPALPHALMADIMGGTLSAAMGLLAALVDVQRGGPGRHVDVSITDCMLAHNILALGADATEARPLQPSIHSGANLRYRLYETADGRHMAIGAQEKQFWDEACDALGRPDFKPHHLAPSSAECPVTRDIEATFRSRTQAEWINRFRGRDACVTPVLFPREAVRHEHFVERDLVACPDTAAPAAFGFPIRMTDAAFDVRLDPPSPGQHTAEILGNIGFPPNKIADLMTRGVVRKPGAGSVGQEEPAR
ncbi:CoA transferase [Vineibacter terrae]|uniref:CoA transferase n=1 Tax=Vineibacter terrae TaxID=2586908 RepID=A0A5C8P6S8_9HYPH|nr:CaiB/BaiF CoA-transferase family protein [Vineibacter terrae]TXL69327.1 CoA transferase [Vineibacter terrae]